MEVDLRDLVTAGLVAGLLAGYGIALPVGAIATYLVALSARTSLRVGCAAAALGVASADGVYALAAGLGSGALANQLSRFATPMRVAAAGALIALAVRTATLAMRRHSAPGLAHAGSDGRLSPSRAYAGLFGLTVVNPTTIVYFTALVAGNRFAALGQPLFVVAAFIASASWQLLLAASGAALGRTLTGHRGQLITALVSSLVIVALALRLLLAG